MRYILSHYNFEEVHYTYVNITNISENIFHRSEKGHITISCTIFVNIFIVVFKKITINLMDISGLHISVLCFKVALSLPLNIYLCSLI